MNFAWLTNLSNKEILLLFASRIKNLRKEHGLTQEQLAYECGISPSQIVRIENAKINTTIITLYKLSLVFEIPIYTLLEF